MFETEQKEINCRIKEICQHLGYDCIESKWTWIPFSGQWGISTSFFEIASKNLEKDPTLTVIELSKKISENVKEGLGNLVGFDRVEATGGYLNLYFNTNLYAYQVINTVLDEGDTFGKGDATFQKIMVEFSQPNSLKSFHVGHLRNMVLGDAVCNILEASGAEVIRANYLGDIGLHVITWLWNYLKLHDGEEPPSENKIRWMGELYSEAVRLREESPENKTEVKEIFQRWDQRDPQIVALWKKTRAWSLEAFNQIYRILGIHFDHIYYESEEEESGKVLVNDLIVRKIAKDERPDGAVVVYLDELMETKDIYRDLVLLRSDGTSLYSTKDIPLAIKKFEQYKLDRSIYVVDVRQSLYLKQIFKILELMGYDWAKRCYHLAYEIVNLPGNVTIASREGTVVFLEDLISEAHKRALRIVEEKNPDLSKEQKAIIAQSVALGAIKYSLLSRDINKIVTFDWNSALDVNGQAAPYIQYAGVRASSILRKVSLQIPNASEISFKLTKSEIQLIDLISRLPQEVQRAAKDLKPLLITSYSYEIARAFNDFYSSCPVLQAEKEIRNFRIRLVAAARQTIINSLKLLGIEVPDVM